MEKKNLNKDFINVCALGFGTHDFLVKTGRKYQTLRIEKNAVNCCVSLYESASVKNVCRVGSLWFDNEKIGMINRAFIEKFGAVYRAVFVLKTSGIDCKLV